MLVKIHVDVAVDVYRYDGIEPASSKKQSSIKNGAIKLRFLCLHLKGRQSQASLKRLQDLA